MRRTNDHKKLLVSVEKIKALATPQLASVNGGRKVPPCPNSVGY